jgi:hypothetical protein
MITVRNEAVTTASFGQVDGQEASLFTLENDGIRVGITDYGGRLVSIEAPIAAGAARKSCWASEMQSLIPKRRVRSAHSSAAMPTASPAPPS